jgi:hypothetical protein
MSGIFLSQQQPKHPNRDEFRTETRNRIKELIGKKCGQCGETRIKALLRQKDHTISCYNCKKHNKKYAYEISGNMQRNTRLHYEEISALNGHCYNDYCSEIRPKTLMVISFRGGKGLICRNCDRCNNKKLRYETYDNVVLPW